MYSARWEEMNSAIRIEIKPFLLRFYCNAPSLLVHFHSSPALPPTLHFHGWKANYFCSGSSSHGLLMILKIMLCHAQRLQGFTDVVSTWPWPAQSFTWKSCKWQKFNNWVSPARPVGQAKISPHRQFLHLLWAQPTCAALLLATELWHLTAAHQKEGSHLPNHHQPPGPVGETLKEVLNYYSKNFKKMWSWHSRHAAIDSIYNLWCTDL